MMTLVALDGIGNRLTAYLWRHL